MSKVLFLGGMSAALMAGVCFAAEGASGSAGRSPTIKEALSRLDTSNDDHWTEAGLPSMEVMKKLTGNPDLKRAEVGEASPNFHRTNNSAAKSDATANAGPSGETELEKANEYRAPNLDPKDNPNVGKTDVGPYETQTHTADQGERLAAQLGGEDVTGREPADLAARIKDPIFLIEAAIAAANADERYRTNSELQTFFRHYSVAQVNIRAHQARLDDRHKRRQEAEK